MIRRLRIVLIGVATAGVVWSAGAITGAVYAGSDGQQLSLYDTNGNIQSAYLSGDNQNNCYYETLPISNWPSTYYNTNGYWWQNWSGCPNGSVQPKVKAYSGINWTGSQFATFNLTSGPPHSQSGDWWTCQVDGGTACKSGYEAY